MERIILLLASYVKLVYHYLATHYWVWLIATAKVPPEFVVRQLRTNAFPLKPI